MKTGRIIGRTMRSTMYSRTRAVIRNLASSLASGRLAGSRHQSSGTSASRSTPSKGALATLTESPRSWL
ncbi:hypothetical protein D9M68_951660 [compost metagenome]